MNHIERNWTEKELADMEAGRIPGTGRARGVESWHAGMNKGETRYAQYLELLKRAGVIREYWVKAVTLLLGPDLRYTPDFLVMLEDYTLCLDDVKGRKQTEAWCEEDARVKIHAAAAQFPFTLRIVWPEPNGEWNVKVI